MCNFVNYVAATSNLSEKISGFIEVSEIMKKRSHLLTISLILSTYSVHFVYGISYSIYSSLPSASASAETAIANKREAFSFLSSPNKQLQYKQQHGDLSSSLLNDNNDKHFSQDNTSGPLSLNLLPVIHSQRQSNGDSVRNEQQQPATLRRQKRTVPFLLLPIPYQVNASNVRIHEEHDRAAANNIFRNLLRLSVSKTNASAGNVSTTPIPYELTFHEGQTIATIYTKPNDDAVYCNLIEVNTPEESDRVLKIFAQQLRRVLKTSFRTILSIITACQALDGDTTIDVKTAKSNSYMQLTTTSASIINIPLDNMKTSSERLISQTQPIPSEMWSVISGILPGTKWCGLGDIARDYHDLGNEKGLDKCCRAHDLCPTKVKALRSGYGLINWSFYTKSHCDCDSLLYDCLKKATNPTADMLGNFYFNILKVQCIDEEEPKKCIIFDEVTNQCRSWQPNPELSNAQKRMFFRNTMRSF